MPPVKDFIVTAHALERIAERGLSLEQLKCVINYHDKKKQQYKGENGGFVYKFEKMVDGRKIFAVGEIKKSECWLISGWYEN